MKIAIEARALATEPKNGVYFYLQRLLKALFELDAKNSYTLFYFYPPKRTDFNLPVDRYQTRVIRWFPGKLYRLLLRTPLGIPVNLIASIQADVFLFPSFARWPLFGPQKSISVIHDTSYLDYPQATANRFFRWYLTKAVKETVKKSTHLIAVSNNTRRQVIKHYGVDPTKISVISPAIDHQIYRPAPAREIKVMREKLGITGDYILYLGTLEPRKNILGIIEAYNSLPQEFQRQHQLVLGGGKGWLDTEINAAIETLPSDRVIKAGYVSDADIVALYSGATCYIYPSHYEGWGMQILEAMACGTPVITSDNSSLPEVGGNAALYVQSEDQSTINEALLRVLKDPALRSQMSRAGIAHAKSFTWETSAKKLKTLLEAVHQQ